MWNKWRLKRSRGGELFFAGTGGLNSFFPDTIKINQQTPSIRISRAQLNGGILPGADSEFLFPDANYLPYGFGELRLELAILDFNNPLKNRMQYRNAKQGQPWKGMQQPFLEIRGLGVGSHTFEFRGSNNDGVWSIEPASIEFVITPPFYRHPLMLVFYLLLSVLVPMLFLNNKQRRMVETQQALESEVAKRTHELELANSSRERCQSP